MSAYDFFKLDADDQEMSEAERKEHVRGGAAIFNSPTFKYVMKLQHAQAFAGAQDALLKGDHVAAQRLASVLATVADVYEQFRLLSEEAGAVSPPEDDEDLIP